MFVVERTIIKIAVFILLKTNKRQCPNEHENADFQSKISTWPSVLGNKLREKFRTLENHSVYCLSFKKNNK